jgi:hypothetical protein
VLVIILKYFWHKIVTMKNTLFGLLALLICLPALAARPFVTDDARLTTGGSCQLESWARHYSDSREVWALPACNPGGNFEVTLGGGRARNDGESSTSDYVLQLKTLFRPLETNGWGIGLAAGSVRHPEIKPGPNQLGNEFAYVPLSASFYEDKIIMHANLGWLRDHKSHQSNMTWGLGGEFYLNGRLIGIAEVFGDSRAQRFGQTGLRFAVIPNLFQIDATVGQQFDAPGSSRWVSVGIRLTPERLF